MPDTTTNGSEPTARKIEFIAYHEPLLKAGDYEITVKQEIEVDGKEPEIKVDGNKSPQGQSPFQSRRTFSVYGERFALKPQDIHAVFPPAGSLGDHSNVLPHIVLNRSTLPWERQLSEDVQHIPWLALLLFDEGEEALTTILPLTELLSSSATAPKFPGLPPESGQEDGDFKVTVVDVKRELLEKILPTPEDLGYLAHVRQATDAKRNPVGDALAVVIGNRLSRRGGTSTVHLVSVESRYKHGEFDYQEAEDDESVRLVSLTSWRFACADEDQRFKDLLMGLDLEPSTLRLPKSDRAEAEGYLAQGYVPVRHHLRRGGQTFSWYHGPLAPGKNPTADITLPVGTADQLLRYNPTNGMFDVSYAAAWQLGRLLALQSKHFSVSLYNWKRAHAQELERAEEALVLSYLPWYGQARTASEVPEVPGEIASWFWRMSLLQGVPFGYLVPDEDMLPNESIRFVGMDRLWVECLLDGAFSIGRVTTADHEQDRSLAKSLAAGRPDIVSGFLLRSAVVAGWPGLLVDAYDEVIHDDHSETPLTMLRMDRLSANVLLCLFEGEVKTVDIHQKPEALHLGVDQPDASHKDYYKQLRGPEGHPSDLAVDPIPRREPDERVIDIAHLAEAIQEQLPAADTEFTSAQFALEMMERVEKVRFLKQE